MRSLVFSGPWRNESAGKPMDERPYLLRGEVLARARKRRTPKLNRPVRAIWMSPSLLRPHPRRCVEHSGFQIQLLIDSLTRYGCCRNVVVAQDDTILAGHAVVEAAVEMGLAQIPVVRLGLDPESKAALQLLFDDNELAALAERDDNRTDALLAALAER